MKSPDTQPRSKQPATARRAGQYGVYAALALAAAYITGSYALDTGSLLLYAATFVGLYYAVHFAVAAIRPFVRRNR